MRRKSKQDIRIASHPTGLPIRFLPTEMPGELQKEKAAGMAASLKLTSTLSARGRTCRLRIHRRNLLQQGVHAAPSLQSGVDRWMAFSVRVRDQDASPRLRLLDHISQVMAVIFGQSRAQDHEVKCPLFQGVLHLMASFRLGDLVACLFDRNCLFSEDF